MKNLVRTLLVATVATLAVLAGSAVAAPPQVLHSNDSGRVQDVDFCGITTDLAFRFSQTEMLFFDKDGNIVRHESTGSVRNTFTAANGKSAIVQAAGRTTDTEVIDEAANTITFTTTFIGLPEKIQTGHGPVLLRDAGLLSFVDTFDLTTFDHISSDFIIRGPHPEAESDFTLFCQVAADALA